MNAVAKEVSQTPITDAAAGCTPSFDDGDRCVHVDVARKLETDRAALIAALQAFVDQATKVSGFPQAYEPYVGALVLARATLARIGAA